MKTFNTILLAYKFGEIKEYKANTYNKLVEKKENILELYFVSNDIEIGHILEIGDLYFLVLDIKDWWYKVKLINLSDKDILLSSIDEFRNGLYLNKEIYIKATTG